jgi:hypothetical protein
MLQLYNIYLFFIFVYPAVFRPSSVRRCLRQQPLMHYCSGICSKTAFRPPLLSETAVFP